VRDGYLAVGSDTTDAAANPRSPLLWVSADARDWRLAGPPAHQGTMVANGQQTLVFTRTTTGSAALEAWVSLDGRQWTQLPFGGDLADVPAFETGVGQPSRVDQVFLARQGVVVLGQLNGHRAAWFADASP